LADIFIAYSRLDQERVKPLAERLISLGYSVLWDKSERLRQGSVDERAQELEAASAVLCVWSLNGADSSRLHACAAHAFDAGKMIQVKLDSPPPPVPFDAAPAFDMSGAGEWGNFEQALSQLVRHGENAPSERTRLGLMPVMTAAGSPRLVTIAAVAALTAYAGALGASFNGIMTADQLQIALVGMLGVAGACAGLSAYRFRSIARADA